MTMEFTVPNPNPEDEQPFMNKKKFSKMVEKEVRHSGMTYLDTIVHLCEKNGLEVEDVKKYLTPSILEHLESEAMRLNFLVKGNTLDV